MGYRRDKSPHCFRLALAGLALSSLFTAPSIAEVVSIDVASRDTLTTADVNFSYESITGVVHFTLDPNEAANAAVASWAFVALPALEPNLCGHQALDFPEPSCLSGERGT